MCKLIIGLLLGMFSLSYGLTSSSLAAQTGQEYVNLFKGYGILTEDSTVDDAGNLKGNFVALYNPKPEVVEAIPANVIWVGIISANYPAVLVMPDHVIVVSIYASMSQEVSLALNQKPNVAFIKILDVLGDETVARIPSHINRVEVVGKFNEDVLSALIAKQSVKFLQFSTLTSEQTGIFDFFAGSRFNYGGVKNGTIVFIDGNSSN